MLQFQVTSDFVFLLKYISSIVWKDIRLREAMGREKEIWNPDFN